MISKPAQKKLCQRSRDRPEAYPKAPETFEEYANIEDKYRKTLDEAPFLLGQKSIESGIILMFSTVGKIWMFLVNRIKHNYQNKIMSRYHNPASIIKGVDA